MSDGATIALASIFVGGITVGTPLIITAFNSRKSAQNTQETKETIGAKNGNGDLMQMMSRVLAWQAEQSREQQLAIADLRNFDEGEADYNHWRNHKILNMLTVTKGKVDLMWEYFAKEHGLSEKDLPKVPYPEAEESGSEPVQPKRPARRMSADETVTKRRTS